MVPKQSKQVNNMELITGQSKAEKEYLIKISEKNANRSRLPRGHYAMKKSQEPSE